MAGMRYSKDSFARLVGGAVKAAVPEARVDTCGGFGYVVLPGGQAFRFEVQEVAPEDAETILGALAEPEGGSGEPAVGG